MSTEMQAHSTVMLTPWGGADAAYKLAEGAYWVSTSTHGGLMVSWRVAREKLSEAARKVGFGWSYWCCFEEDCAYAVAFYEIPDWFRAAGAPNIGMRFEDGGYPAEASDERIRAEMLPIIRRWTPDYLALDLHAGR